MRPYPDAPWVRRLARAFSRRSAPSWISRASGRVASLVSASLLSEFATRPWPLRGGRVRDHAMNLTDLMRQHLGELANHVVRICAERRSYDDTLTDAA